MDGGNPDEFWFCVRHHRVETTENLCPAKHRLGPYPSEAEARRALEKAEERNREWDEDPAWDDAARNDG
ncbi:hypothetical protein [Nocardioides sp. GY 10127]|uniref:hypothetical protein n=1 Tax=Nocardioides sp. GY 10127 TaxID=2569762 RepID=UPI0010A8152C|nr:hypothetical protein [Nocardioides sp. GY 10127]TIC85674.1 hypothetical protein E8D37_03430 [Nocardioides sp. GY 10127]